MKVSAFRGWPLMLLLSSLIFAGAPVSAQDGPIRPSGTQTPGQQTQAPAQQTPPPQPAPAPTAPEQPGYAITVTVPIVNVDAVVTDDDGNYLQQLKKENFRLTEDGAPQIITNFSTGDAPITVAIIVEYSQLGYGWFHYDAVTWADVFLRQLKPVDWIALESFNMRTNVEVDFTHNPRDVERGLQSLVFPPFYESNVFDAVAETVDRMRGVRGKKAILLLASGRDTFSKLTFDKTMARLKESDVTIYCVGVAEQFALEMETHGGLGTNELTHIQAQQYLKAFAETTGGRAWFPRFDAEIPGVMRDAATSIRFQYNLAYSPTNQATDGKYRKIKVELVDDNGKPLVMNDAKGKKIKYQVHFRQGYVAPKSLIN